MQLPLLGKPIGVSESANGLIPGLFLIPGFISSEEEKHLLKRIDEDYASEWRSDLARRVQHYGYRYDYKAKRVDASMRLGSLPDFLGNLAKKLLQKDWFEQEPDQAIINEYLPGQGISAHVDCVPCFGPVVASLSLGSDCLMDFRRKADGQLRTVILERRSLFVLTKDARFKWTHAIPGRLTDKLDGATLERTRRLSITFRTVIIDRATRSTVGRGRPRTADDADERPATVVSNSTTRRR